ncbi:MAG TPA: GDP-L-fucose synthase [Silvibacterium sp.]|nr:GDP-L-fucose synthase [Silvibacterium sp.]
MDKGSRILVAGHRGLAGSAIRRELEQQGYTNLLLRTRAELDLTRSADVEEFFTRERPDYVILAAAKVGGILANKTMPGDFLRENLAIQNNVLNSAQANGVRRLLFLGSSCIYPRLAPQPIREEYLLTGPLEPTNRSYALAKIAGIEMCWAFNRQYGTKFFAVMPTNLYGPGENLDLETSHVLAALVRKVIQAKAAGLSTIDVWGSGTPRREFLYNDDLARACVFLLSLPDAKFNLLLKDDEPPLLNVGTGEDLAIRQLAELICRIVGFEGELVFDASKPDGTPRKLLDVSRIHALGWKAQTTLEEGIRATVRDFEKRLEIPEVQLRV